MLVLPKQKKKRNRQICSTYLLKCQMLWQTRTYLIQVPISKKLIQIKNIVFRIRIRSTCCAQRRIQRNLSVLKGVYRVAEEGLLARAYSDRTRGNSFKLKEVRISLAIGKKFFAMRTVKHWHRFPRLL